MIITVCMNPAVDKTVEIIRLMAGGLNRIKKVEYDAGGKGINVSKTIRELGGKSIATGFLGGNTGKVVEAALVEQKILCDFIHVDGETRTNTKVIEECGRVTELNEPGPVIRQEELQGLLNKLESYAGEDTLFILAGSVPKGIEPDIYEKITALVHKKGAKVLLDADGELFRKALLAIPDMIKPNHVELEEFVGADLGTREALKEAARAFLQQGIDTVVISLGEDGALFLWKDDEAEALPLPVQAHSTVGAGDAMVAAMAHAWENKLNREETIRLCMAASAGAVTAMGTKPPKKEVVEELKTRVVIMEGRGNEQPFYPAGKN